MGHPLTQRIGDTKTHSIKMVWEGRPFVPGIEWNLIFTLKSDPDTQDDSSAIFQKRYGAGITVSGSTAYVEVVPIDTAGGTYDPGGPEEAVIPPRDPGTYYWDIQAQKLADENDVRTVASSTMSLTRDVTRSTDLSLTIYTTNPDAPIQVPIPNVLSIGTVTTGDPGTDAIATIGGTAPTQTLSLTIPRGSQGEQGEQGEQGPAGAQPYFAATPPADTSLIWFHTGLGIWFVYDTDSWIAQSPDSGIPDGALTFGGDVLTFGGDTLTFTAA